MGEASYYYDTAGRLVVVGIEDDVLRATTSLDALGRVTGYSEYAFNIAQAKSAKQRSGYDVYGQSLTGRSNYNAGTQFGRIISDVGSVSIGTTLSQLGTFLTYTVPDAAQRNAEIFAEDQRFAELDRLRGGTVSGIALGLSQQFGASQATQDLVYGLGASADGLLLSGAGVRGAVIPGISNQRGITGILENAGVNGNSKLSPRTAYLYELYTKDGAFLKNGITQNVETRYTKAFIADKDIIPIASGSRANMLALEREITIANPGPLNREPFAVKARATQLKGNGQ